MGRPSGRERSERGESRAEIRKETHTRVRLTGTPAGNGEFESTVITKSLDYISKTRLIFSKTCYFCIQSKLIQYNFGYVDPLEMGVFGTWKCSMNIPVKSKCTSFNPIISWKGYLHYSGLIF